MKYTYLDERASGVINHEGEFSTRKGFQPGEYVAVMAQEGSKLVGAFRAFRQVTPGGLEAAGTWVRPAYRKHGVAQKLWRRMLRETQPKSVTVMTISRNGARLVRALQKRYPKIRWEHETR